MSVDVPKTPPLPRYPYPWFALTITLPPTMFSDSIATGFPVANPIFQQPVLSDARHAGQPIAACIHTLGLHHIYIALAMPGRPHHST